MNKFSIFICCAGTFGLASAAFTAELPPELIACAEEANDLRRLVCYDEAVSGLRRSGAQITTAAAAPVAESTMAEAPVAEATVEAVDAAPEAVVAEAPPQAPDEPVATPAPAVAPAQQSMPEAAAVTTDVAEEPQDGQVFVVQEVFQQPRGEHTVVLENGDVWQENTASRYFPIEAGDRVTLKKRLFGGYRLIAESGKALSVSRK